jgi:hypothetical protein
MKKKRFLSFSDALKSLNLQKFLTEESPEKKLNGRKFKMCCCFCNNSNNEEEEEEDGEMGEMATRDLFCARESLLRWRRNTAPLTVSFLTQGGSVRVKSSISLLNSSRCCLKLFSGPQN